MGSPAVMVVGDVTAGVAQLSQPAAVPAPMAHQAGRIAA